MAGRSPRAKAALFCTVRPSMRPTSSRLRPRRSPSDTAWTFSATSSAAFCATSVCRMRSLTWASGGTDSSFLEFSRITWYPNDVFTRSEVWPGCRSKATLSNSGTMRPRGEQPRSPPCAADPVSSDTLRATAAKSAPPFTWSRAAWASLRASSSGWPSVASGVAFTLTRMWLLHASSGSVNCSRRSA